MSLMDSALTAISPLDGRYRTKIQQLAEVTSEAALIKERLRVEAGWLLWLAKHEPFVQEMNLTEELKAVIMSYFDAPPNEAVLRVKEIERETNHDVKAVEYQLCELLQKSGGSPKLLSYVHFACTSEDINNIAYGVILKRARSELIFPLMTRIIQSLLNDAQLWAEVGMLSRTHGQSATPTTVGKEFAVFAHRLDRQRILFKEQTILAKMNGAVGNYNAHMVAYPEVDWPEVTKGFIEDFMGLTQNTMTTQIENHDAMVEYFEIIKRFNTILIGLCRDIWSYISLGYFKQKLSPKEVGSSTMPHKVNPIDFENAEGNLGIANAIAQHYAEKLPISRWQRDLSDSTVQRTIGTMLGHTMVAYEAFLKGLSKLQLDANKIADDLDSSWEVIAEPLQTVMRRYGVPNAYERLKAATRGAHVEREMLAEIIRQTSEIPAHAREQLLKLTPGTYLGAAERLTRELIRSWQE